MPRRRFVVLQHDYPFLHWDLLLEAGDVLKSWRLLRPVSTGLWIPAESLPDHRSKYLDYEGPVSGDRGSVKRVMAGHFEQVSADDEVIEYKFSDCELKSGCCRTVDSQVEWRFS